MLNSLLFRQAKKLIFAGKFAPYFFLFIISLILFVFLQADFTLGDPDSFYHVKISQLFIERGIFKTFPWLQFTVLKDVYSDHHFLYHLLLLPFISFTHPLIGAKIAAIVFNSIFILVIYWFLRRFNIRYALWYALFLLTINPFLFRASLVKAPILSLIVLFFILFALFEQRLRLLFFLSFIYVWLHGSWPLAGVVMGVYFLVLQGFEFFANKKLTLKNFFRIACKHYFLIVVSLGGLVAGLIINPFFPQNFKFYYYQIYEIAAKNYREVIGVGNEWYPYHFFDLVRDTPLTFVLIFLGVIFFGFGWRRQNEKSITLFILSLIFFVLTLRSRRNVEYFMPFTAVFAAFSISYGLKAPFVLNGLSKIKKIINSKVKFVLFIGLIICLGVGGYVIWRDVGRVKNNLKNSTSLRYLEQPSLWLKENTPEKSIVFHSDWDDFPALFYYNSHNYYIMGLDPTFMYRYNPDIYQKWVEITTGRPLKDLHEIIKNEFRASYVIVDNEHAGMEIALRIRDGFEKVYDDGRVRIFAVE